MSPKQALSSEDSNSPNNLDQIQQQDSALAKRYGLIENHFKLKEEVKLNSHIAVGLDYESRNKRESSHYVKSRPVRES